jgi:hypothetical protein
MSVHPVVVIRMTVPVLTRSPRSRQRWLWRHLAIIWKKSSTADSGLTHHQISLTASPRTEHTCLAQRSLALQWPLLIGTQRDSTRMGSCILRLDQRHADHRNAIGDHTYHLASDVSCPVFCLQLQKERLERIVVRNQLDLAPVRQTNTDRRPGTIHLFRQLDAS